MKKLALARVTVGAALLLAGCSRKIDNGDAVRQGVVDYLKARMSQTGLDVNLMQVDVTAVTFQKDEAHATVYFRPKGAPNQGGMQMSYTLDRKGDQWVVRPRSAGGGMPHAGPSPSEMSPGPENMPAMPPNHPSTGGPSEALPPGHPPVGSKQ